MKTHHTVQYFDPVKYKARTGLDAVVGPQSITLPDGAPNPAPEDLTVPVKPEAAIAAIKAGSVNPADLAAYCKWKIQVGVE